LLYYIITYIKKTSKCNVIKTVLSKEKTAAAEKLFKKIFKKEKTDINKKKKNAIDIKENIKAFKSAYYWKLNSKFNFNI